MQSTYYACPFVVNLSVVDDSCGTRTGSVPVAITGGVAPLEVEVTVFNTFTTQDSVFTVEGSNAA